jgi:hypothetical protein
MQCRLFPKVWKYHYEGCEGQTANKRRITTTFLLQDLVFVQGGIPNEKQLVHSVFGILIVVDRICIG